MKAPFGVSFSDSTTLTDRDLATMRSLPPRRYRIVGGENSIRYKRRIKVRKPLERPPELPER